MEQQTHVTKSSSGTTTVHCIGHSFRASGDWWRRLLWWVSVLWMLDRIGITLLRVHLRRIRRVDHTRMRWGTADTAEGRTDIEAPPAGCCGATKLLRLISFLLTVVCVTFCRYEQ